MTYNTMYFKPQFIVIVRIKLSTDFIMDFEWPAENIRSFSTHCSLPRVIDNDIRKTVEALTFSQGTRIRGNLVRFVVTLCHQQPQSNILRTFLI